MIHQGILRRESGSRKSLSGGRRKTSRRNEWGGGGSYPVLDSVGVSPRERKGDDYRP